MIGGHQLAHRDDEELLAYGMTLFASRYRSFEQWVHWYFADPATRPSQPGLWR